MTTKPDRIAVIILSYNQREKTLACLTALLEKPQLPFFVLVWDNGSQDGTVEAVRKAFPTVLAHHSPENLGVAGGRNAAAQLAVMEFFPNRLLFLDNDILVEPDFVAALAKALAEDPRAGQAQAKLLFMHDRRRINDGGGAQIDFVFWQIRPVGYGEIDRGQHDSQRECISCGGAMMVRTDVFQKLGGFDPVFGPFGPEDLDFSLRLQKAGYKALYVPAAVGYHQVSHTFGKGYSEEYARHKSRHWLRFMQRHATFAQKAAFYLVGAPTLAFKVVIREGKRGNWKAVRGLLRGILKH